MTRGAALSPGSGRASWLFGVFFLLMVLRVPVAFALGLACLPVLIIEPRLSPMVIFNTTFKAYNSFILLAVPFFLLTANLMNVGGITDRLVHLSRTMVGNFPGALAQINVLLSVFFAGISGIVDGRRREPGQDLHRGAGQGRLRPLVLDRDHRGVGGARGDHPAVDPDGRLGRRAAGVDRRAVSRRRDSRAADRSRADGDRARLRQGAQLPDVSARDASRSSSRRRRGRDSGADDAVHHRRRHPARLVHRHRVRRRRRCIYAAVLSLGVYREMGREKLWHALLETGKLVRRSRCSASGTASVFGWLLAYFQIPKALLANVATWGMGPIGVGFFIVFVFLVVGCFLDAIPAIIIVGTMLQPLAASVGMHPVSFAIISIVALAFGLVTPPYGMCLMVSCAIAKVRLRYALKDTMIMLVPMLLVLAAMIIWPRDSAVPAGADPAGIPEVATACVGQLYRSRVSGTKRTAIVLRVTARPSASLVITSRSCTPWREPTGITMRPPRRELVDQRLRHVVGRGGDDDRVERRRFGPALVAVADAHLDVAIAERSASSVRACSPSGCTISIV